MSAEPVFLLIEEAAEIARTSAATVRYWIMIGKLPSVKPGRRRLIRRDVLIRFIEGAPALDA